MIVPQRFTAEAHTIFALAPIATTRHSPSGDREAGGLSFLMPSATMGEIMAGPYGQWPELEPEEGTRWRKVEDYSEFLICQVEDRARGSSVCEQRNAALVRATLGEKEEVSA